MERMAFLGLMLFGLLLLAKQSTQLSLNHPLYGTIRRINDNAGPFLGLVVTSTASENALIASGVFTRYEALELNGRQFNVGKIKDADVVYLNAGGDLTNVAISLQMLLDAFNMRGIVQFGSAGSVDSSLSLGDVAVPESFAFTGNWEWKKDTSKGGKLKFGDYNQPEKGENSLGSVNYLKVKVYSAANAPQNLFWLPSDPAWLNIANQLKDLELEQCVKVTGPNSSNCLPSAPQVVLGLKGSSADIYYKNEAIAEFLFKRLKVSTVDTTNAATTLASLTNGVPSIAFCGISNSVTGAEADSTSRTLATLNALTAALKFIGLVSGNSGGVYDN